MRFQMFFSSFQLPFAFARVNKQHEHWTHTHNTSISPFAFQWHFLYDSKCLITKYVFLECERINKIDRKAFSFPVEKQINYVSLKIASEVMKYYIHIASYVIHEECDGEKFVQTFWISIRKFTHTHTHTCSYSLHERLELSLFKGIP